MKKEYVEILDMDNIEEVFITKDKIELEREIEKLDRELQKLADDDIKTKKNKDGL